MPAEGCMGFFKLRSLPGTAWPLVPYPQVGLVWNAYQELDRTQWLSPAEIQMHQLRQLNELLAHCRKNVPYYARVLCEAGLGNGEISSFDDYRRIPFLTRELYQQHQSELLANALPDGMIAAEKPSYTSGTSGVPIAVHKSNHDALWWSAFYLRDLEWCGIDPRGTLAAIRLLAYKSEDLPAALRGTKSATWNNSLALLIESGPGYGIDVRLDPRKQLQWLRQVRPDYLISMPTNLEFLASLLRENNEKLDSLKMIQTMGEPLPRDVRQNIESGFGVPVKNLYSTTESGYIASECPSGNGLHVHSENVIAEVLDADNNPCKPRETGRLVFTSLHSFMNPFIRYEIQDEVTLADAPCICGRGLPLWSHVDGRRYPSLHLPTGAKKSSMGIVLGLRQVAGVHQFQFIQRAADHAIVRVVPDQSWTPEHPQRIIERVQLELEAPIHVDVEVNEYLERPRGGKLKLVIVEC
jgi:phenylacetate-CoA ligase